MHKLIPLLLGGLFGLGICLAELGNPTKLLNSLAILDGWDPSLYVSVLGILGIFFLGHKIFKGQQPFFVSKNKIDPWLFFAIVFCGTGFALSGFLPGTAIAGTVSLELENFAFLLAFLFGGMIAKSVLGDEGS